MPGAPDGRPGPIRRVYARSASRLAIELEQLESGASGPGPGLASLRRAAAGGSRLGQRAADLRPPFADGLRDRNGAAAGAAAEADAAELVGVLVDEPDCDAVVLGDAAGGPQPIVVGSGRFGARGFSARRDLCPVARLSGW